jgi:hypothetical protein
MKEMRKEIFQKLRSWIKKAGVSFDVVLSEQKAPLPNSAVVVIDPLQIYGNVGHMSKTKPEFETGNEVLLLDKISEHQIEAVMYFLDSIDGKQDSSGEFMKLLANLQDNVFDRFDKSKTEAISVLKAQQVSLQLDTNGAEYRRTYALRLILLLSILWKTNADPIESMDLNSQFTKPNGEII